MSYLQAIDYNSSSASEDFVHSLQQTGFGVLKNHPISAEEVNNIYEQWHEFFGSDEKYNYTCEDNHQDGLFTTTKAETAKGHTAQDIKEYYHYYPWGKCPPALRSITYNYYENTRKFAQRLLSWIEQHSPKKIAKSYSIPLTQMTHNSNNTLLRILHYPPLPDNIEPNALRAAAHEDINFLTILPAANEPGLEVKSKEGKWLPVPCDFGNLIINIGDMLQEASGGYFRSTSHRVVNPKGMDKSKSRISMPLFLHAHDDVVLSERYTMASYLAERLNEIRAK